MTKKELIRFLADYPDEIEIVLAKDAEGNSVSPLDEAAHQYYYSENKWSGELSDSPGLGFDKSVISLWPVN